MPVTAKLSRAFYDKLGDDATNELVNWFNSVDLDYRTELRALNELNFARFDAKVAQRFAEQDAKWERRFAEQDVKWVRRFSQLETRLVRWMFAFWATTMVTQAAQLFAVLRLK
jgi:hypothetical protein